MCKWCVIYRKGTTMKSYSISQRNKSRGSLVWYGREYENGLLVKEISLKTTNKKEARIWLDAMNVSRFLPESMRSNSLASRVTIVDAVNAYLDHQSTHVTDASYKSSLSALKRLKRYCEEVGMEKLTNIDRKFADDFYLSMDISDNSKKTVFTIVKAFVGWSFEHYSVEKKNPFVGVKIAKVVKLQKGFWTEEEIDTILDNADPVQRLFMSLMAFAGLRHSEVLTIVPGSIVDGRIRVLGKGNKEAFIPVSERLAAELSRVDLKEGMFRPYRHDGKANEMIRDVVRSSGLDPTDATCHKFRHSFVSNLARNGVVESVASKLARHSDITTTMKFYTHFRDDDLKEAINTKKEG